MNTTTIILYCLLAALAGAAATLGWFKFKAQAHRDALRLEADQWLETARRQVETERGQRILDAKEAVLQLKSAAEAEIAELRKAQRQREQILDRKDESLQQQEEDLRKQQRGLEASQHRLTAQLQELNQQQATLQELRRQQIEVLQQASQLTPQEAEQKLLQALEQELEEQRGVALLRHQATLQASAERQAREILLTAMQRYAAAHTADSTTSTVDVANDDMKGRIIGREGRNIRAFEKETGVDLVIDDTPGVVIVSSFDPVRREVARQALGTLVADGRIHPSRIEEVVAETAGQIDDVILEKGRQAADEVNVTGLDPRLIETLGRLHYRTSYSQNVLRHSVEVAFIAGMIAEMIGLDPALARRCGLLHDLGKAADHELEGGHPKIGADLLRRHGEPPEVVHAALGHHDEIVTEYPYTMLTAIGDACSAARPGARRESLERYIKRMEELEAIPRRFAGVRQAFAISAGRELRVLVHSDRTSDQQAAVICRDIARALESELTYPGEIKVTVVRESRFSETAR